jgi:hypothetical protein
VLMPKKPVPLWPVYLAIVGALMFASEFVQGDKTVPFASTIADPGKQTIDVLAASSQLIVALNTALLSAAAAMTIKGHEWGARWHYVDGVLVMGALASGTVSYYGVYLQHIATLGMVYKGTINPFERSLQWGMSLQYYGVVCEVVLLGLVFSRMLEGRVKA